MLKDDARWKANTLFHGSTTKTEINKSSAHTSSSYAKTSLNIDDYEVEDEN